MILTTKKRLQKITHAVTRAYDVSLKDLRSSSRVRHTTWIRHITMYLLRECTTLSLREISEYLNRKGHWQTLYACKKIKAEMQSDHTLKMHIELFKEQIS